MDNYVRTQLFNWGSPINICRPFLMGCSVPLLRYSSTSCLSNTIMSIVGDAWRKSWGFYYLAYGHSLNAFHFNKILHLCLWLFLVSLHSDPVWFNLTRYWSGWSRDWSGCYQSHSIPLVSIVSYISNSWGFPEF